MKNELKKKSGIKNLIISIGAVSVIGSAVGVVAIHENTFDHSEKACPYNFIFGVEHQVNKIEKNNPTVDVLYNNTKDYVDKNNVICVGTKEEPYVTVYMQKEMDLNTNTESVKEIYVTRYKEEPIYDYDKITLSATDKEILIVDPENAEVIKKLELKK